eukprot:COSAG02_NODE_3755_length_6279_cov_5.177832_1_plen_54_part_00
MQAGPVSAVWQQGWCSTAFVTTGRADGGDFCTIAIDGRGTALLNTVERAEREG